MAYDDFEDETIDAWTAAATTGGTMAASTDAKKFGDWGARMTTNGAGAGGIAYTNTDLSQASGNFYCWIRVSNVNQYSGEYSISNLLGQRMGRIAIRSGVLTYSDSGGGAQTFTEVPSADTWYRFRITYDGTTIDYRIYDADNELLEEKLNKTPEYTGTVGEIMLYAEDKPAGVQTIDFDNVCISNTDEPAPPPTGQFMVTQKYW